MTGRVTRAGVSVGLATALVLAAATCSNAVTKSSTGPGGGSGLCESGPPPSGTPAPGQPDEVIIAGAQAPSCQVTCTAGAGIPLLAVVKDVTGAVLKNQSVSWTSSDPSTVSVSGKGLSDTGYVATLTCNQIGTASVAAIDGILEASVSVVSQ